MLNNTTKTTATSINIEKLYNWEWQARPGRGDLTGFREAISEIKPGDIVSDLQKFHVFAFGETGKIWCSAVGTGDVVSIEMTDRYYVVTTPFATYKLSVASQGRKSLIGV